MSYAAQRGGHGRITLSAVHDSDGGWINLTIAGSAFMVAGAPDEALLDESRQFLARIGGSQYEASNSAPLIAVVLSRIIFEFYGGNIEIPKGEPGFVVRLPVTVGEKLS